MNQIYMGASFLNNYNFGNILYVSEIICASLNEKCTDFYVIEVLFFFFFLVLFGVFSLNTKLFSFLFLIVKSKQYIAL